MVLTTSNVYPWKDSSESTHSYKPEDVVRSYPTEWVSNGTGWVSTGKPFYNPQAYTHEFVDSICKDYQKELEAKEKEIEALQKALEVLIGVRDGESADTST